MIIKNFHLLVITLFLILSAIFLFFYLNLDKEKEIKSNLINKEAPEFFVENLTNYKLPKKNDLKTEDYILVNFWASWCAPCRAEHEILKKISQEDIKIIGINYKDNDKKAVEFLKELGNPFQSIGKDHSGKTAINWGIYGVPETFLIDKNGEIILRHPGPLTSEIYNKKFKSFLKKEIIF